MLLYVSFRCNQAFSAKVEAALRGIATISGFNIEFLIDHIAWPTGAWKDVFRILTANGIRRVGSVHFVEGLLPDWRHPDKEWLAAALDFDFSLVGVNPVADYNPRLPAPKKGYIPFDKPILIDEIPSGPGVRVDENYIISKKFYDFLGGNATLRSGGNVVFKGKPLTTWLRFEPLTWVDFLDKDSFSPEMPCGCCGAPYIPTSGILIGKHDEPYDGPVTFDQNGFDHFGATHTVIVSLDQAAAMTNQFRGKEYILEPIYKHGSATARQVREVLDYAQPKG